MEAEQPHRDEKRLKTSAHVCQHCGFFINLRVLGLRGARLGWLSVLKAIGQGRLRFKLSIRNQPAETWVTHREAKAGR